MLTAFRPLFNGEAEHYFTAYDTFSEYFDGDGLNIKAILDRYAEYVARRGFRAFDTEHLKEGAWHYSLDGFFVFFIDRIEGHTFIEVPSGRGRADILILYRNKKYIIETKIFNDKSSFEKGKRQLAAYLKSEGLNEGHYVVFSKKHAEDDVLEQEEMIEGKRIYTRIYALISKGQARNNEDQRHKTQRQAANSFRSRSALFDNDERFFIAYDRNNCRRYG